MGRKTKISWCDSTWCGAVSPNESSKEQAYASAIRRPLQKPLTLEELLEHPDIIVCESKIDGALQCGVCVGEYYEMQDGSVFPVSQDDIEEMESDGLVYGTHYRCWATKPTDEERKAAKWYE